MQCIVEKTFIQSLSYGIILTVQVSCQSLRGWTELYAPPSQLIVIYTMKYMVANIISTFSAQQSPTSAPSSSFLPYVSLGTTDGVETEYVGHFDDGVSHAIHIPNGFPFGTFLHSSVYVSLSYIPCLHVYTYCSHSNLSCMTKIN